MREEQHHHNKCRKNRSCNNPLFQFVTSLLSYRLRIRDTGICQNRRTASNGCLLYFFSAFSAKSSRGNCGAASASALRFPLSPSRGGGVYADAAERSARAEIISFPLNLRAVFAARPPRSRRSGGWSWKTCGKSHTIPLSRNPAITSA